MSGQTSVADPVAAVSSFLGPLYSEILAVITSDLGVLTANILGTATSLPDQSSMPARMTTTIDITLPFSTVTVDSTIFRTSLVTVTVGLAPTTAQPSSSPASPTQTNTLIPLSSSTSSQISLPAIVTPSSQPATTFSYSPSSQPTPSAGSTTTAAPGVQATSTPSSTQSQSQKHAIIGGLSGAIAGLVFIGLLICLILRLRRKKIDPDEFSLNEKGMRPSLVRRFTQFTGGRTSPKPTLPPIEESPSTTTVDEDRGIIRMNTQHWPRPFVSGEGWRDSMPPGTLRVTNPDSSRPGTPRRSSDTIAGGFFYRQRSDLTRAFSRGRRSRTNSSQQPASMQEVPEIRIEPVLSQEIAAPQRPAPSFKSYPSISSMSVIRPHPLDDPFLSPPQNMTHPLPTVFQESTTPTGTPPAHTLGSTLRTWGSFLNPFRSRSSTNTPEQQQQQPNLRNLSHFSTSTRSSRPSRRSDPFDLDRSSMRGSFLPTRLAAELARRGRSSNWILYEGT